MADKLKFIAPRQPSIPAYPSAVFDSDYTKLANEKIKSVHLMRSDMFGGVMQAHSSFVFTTEDGRQINFRGGAEFEPTAANFGKIAGPSIMNRLFDWAYEQTEYNFGRNIVSVTQMPRVEHRDAPDRTPEEDAKTNALDIVNYQSIQPGAGIDGLKPRPNVRLMLLESDPAKAQAFFKEALEVAKKLNTAQFAYTPMPYMDGHTGINSHTTTDVVSHEVDKKQGTKYSELMYNSMNRVVQPASSLPIFFSIPTLGHVGASNNGIDGTLGAEVVRGPSPDTLTANAQNGVGRYIPGSNSKLEIPQADRMPYSRVGAGQ
ncbi:MAG TPA: hypothetical protein VHB73_02200 [Alphaproteobacteria bacterium]|nr:hypothetical protein [Alphaproteobacteria bacterium]